MNMKDKIKLELKKQYEIERNEDNYKLLLFFLEKIKYDSQWRDCVDCKFYHYGVYSYQSYRFYYPKKELIEILKFSK